MTSSSVDSIDIGQLLASSPASTCFGPWLVDRALGRHWPLFGLLGLRPLVGSWDWPISASFWLPRVLQALVVDHGCTQ